MSDTQKLIDHLINDNRVELYKYYQRSDWVNDIDFKKIYNTILNNQNPSCQHMLGYMYKNSYGVDQDYQKARHYYQLAVDQGLSSAQNNLKHLLSKWLDKDLAKYIKELDSKCKGLESKCKQLEEEIVDLKYQPGGVGYTECKDRFENQTYSD